MPSVDSVHIAADVGAGTGAADQDEDHLSEASVPQDEEAPSQEEILMKICIRIIWINIYRQEIWNTEMI